MRKRTPAAVVNMTSTFLLIGVIVFSLTCFVSGNSDVKIYEFSHNTSLSYPGYRFVDHVFEEFSTKRQVIHCAYECLKSTRCRSFNYERDNQMCQLNDADHMEYNSSLVLETNTTAYEYHHRTAFTIDQEALGPCALDPCENGGRCLDTVNANMERIYFCLCTDEWTGTNCELAVNRIDWDDWEEWGPCSVTCETGWTVRRRRCMDLETGETMHENKCYGRHEEFQSCRMDACPRWEVWSEWGECSTMNTCGRGQMNRHRACSNGGTPGRDRYCLGFSNETAPCKGIDCSGMLMIRDIDKHGDGRIEILDDLEDIGMSICADEGWNYTEIDIACKQIGFEGAYTDAAINVYDVTSRVPASPMYTLECLGGERTIQQCRREQVEECNKLGGIQCRIKGGWSLWSNWGECSVTCENGTRVRSRDCNHPPANYNGTPCPGDASQSKPCTKVMCPIDGVWTTWSAWSACDVTCENGTRFRTRTCTGPFYNGAECPGANEDVEDCFPKMCPVDGVWNAWVSWTECSHTCGYGNRNRSRTCHGPFFDGLECPGSTDDMEACNTFSCPVDGSWKLWTAWAECSVTCGGGSRMRTRDCNLPEHGGETCSGPAEEEENCNDDLCPIDGVYAEWEPWTECTVTCANGTRTRTRECFGPYNGGSPCPGVPDETEICVTESCPVDGVWDAWQPWQQCNVTCGGGRKLRQRQCIGPFFSGRECEGPADDWEDCNMFNCPVDGEWNDWSTWEICNVTCGGGNQHRSRTCNTPLHGGDECTGESQQTRSCNTEACPVDGEWTTWEAWTDCSATCGGGNTTRMRTCHQPLHGGEACEGAADETKQCNTLECPVDGFWELWSNWTECTRTCNSGVQTRNRTCTGPFYGGANCSGEADELRTCNEDNCPIDGIFTEWTLWTECSETCGRGSTSRNRTCYGPYFGGAPCVGPEEEVEFCYPSNCPVPGLWNSWSDWTDCSTTCENGTRTRERTCDGPYFGGEDCEGPATDVDDCFLIWCPVDGVWEEWTAWDNCPVTCGGSIQNRTRVCKGPFHDGQECAGPDNESQDCNIHPCPVDGAWSIWSSWSQCNVTCGGGTSGRYRFCSDSQHGGTNCTGPGEQFKDCNTNECPINGEWNTWETWSECSHSCGTGNRERVRTCDGPFHGGANCTGSENDVEDCNTHECPGVQWGPWKVWSACSKSCGGGKKLRVRTCEGTKSDNEGLECEGPTQEFRDCNTQQCPVDGIWETWASWSSCNVTCGGGTRWRYRNCTGPFYGGAECPGEDLSAEDCNTHDCPVDGVWDSWLSWKECSVSCGGGNQSRDRICIGPFYGGAECPAPNNETRECNTHECPIDGVLSDWTEFYSCDVTCGGGIQWRNRTCIGPFHGGANCTDALEDSRQCNTHNCPIDGVYLTWSPWESCDVTCGGGIHWRNRTCDGPYYGGAECVGPDIQNQTCNEFNCPFDGIWKLWSDWDECTVSCGGAIHSRYRTCDGPFYGGANCTGPATESRDCNTNPCPEDGIFRDWSSWYECDVTCGGGVQLRNRSCEGPYYGGKECEGNFTDSQSCNMQECPVDGVWLEWQAWQDCSVSCGGGERLRVRVCEGPFHGGAECDGAAEQTEGCGFAPCPIPGLWHGWSDWTLCTETCGGGVRYRNRTCDMTSFGNLTIACEGDPDETVDCHTFACLPLATNCADWALRGLNQSTYADVDPDGEGTIYEGVVVECDFDTEPGKAVTVIHHDQENRTQVKGYEGAGEYQILLDYFMGWGEAVAIIDGSDECAQFMRWECFAAIIHNPFNPEMLTTFWVNRTGHSTNYFGGATPGSGNCACGETNSCANASLPCNCDINDEVWRVDEGFVTNKAELPILSFYAGDTGANFEDGYKTLGPILCTGFAET